MKKTGFTLAEVLITLSIIGVVAMMTLPALMTNVKEQQAKTGIKKGINTLTEAAQMNNAVEGFDFSGFRVTTANAGDQSIYGLLLARTQVDATKSTLSISSAGNASATNSLSAAARSVLFGNTTVTTNSGGTSVIFFRDGSALVFDAPTTIGTGRSYSANGGGTTLTGGFMAVYDVNGERGPNLLSNCASEKNQTILGNADLRGTGAITDTWDNTCTPANRVIQDQFQLYLHRSNVYPASAASKWAYDN